MTPMDPEIRERLLRLRFLPTRPELSDTEVAERLDTGQPHLQAVQESAAGGGEAALRRALAEHLDACVLSDARDVRFPADWYDAHPGDVQDAASIMRGRIAFDGKLLDIGPRIDWHAWDYPCAESRFVRWFWMRPLVSAYRTTGHGRYARGAMDIVRAFHADARPPAQRPVTWYGYNGPWQALMAAGRVPIALDLYRTIGRSNALDDADRVTFLKLLLEHAEFLYTVSDTHVAHNWEVAMMVALLELAHALPGFRDSPRWKERAVERFTQNMRDCVLDDGGYWERSEYHFSGILEYAVAWRALREAGEPVPPEWPDALQRMYEWAMYVLTPLRQYPPVGHASFGGGRSYVSRFDEERWGGLPEDSMVPVLGEAADLFPERSDFGWFETGRGKPPERTSRVLPHTGLLVMRSGWDPDDLYLVMSYNASPDVIDTHPDLLSVGVWAHGRAYLSNSGSTHGYEASEFRSWDMQTRSSNTVMVDGESQAYLSNGGPAPDVGEPARLRLRCCGQPRLRAVRGRAPPGGAAGQAALLGHPRHPRRRRRHARVPLARPLSTDRSGGRRRRRHDRHGRAGGHAGCSRPACRRTDRRWSRPPARSRHPPAPGKGLTRRSCSGRRGRSRSRWSCIRPGPARPRRRSARCRSPHGARRCRPTKPSAAAWPTARARTSCCWRVPRGPARAGACAPTGKPRMSPCSTAG